MDNDLVELSNLNRQIGCIQATEVVKYIVGVGELLTNKLLVWDGLYAKMDEFAIVRNPKCKDCGGT
jgi:molybdopterin/thiamine biosynthesis adenylyltransferase